MCLLLINNWNIVLVIQTQNNAFYLFKSQSQNNNQKLILVKKNTVNSTEKQVWYNNTFLPVEREGGEKKKQHSDSLEYWNSTFDTTLWENNRA